MAELLTRVSSLDPASYAANRLTDAEREFYAREGACPIVALPFTAAGAQHAGRLASCSAWRPWLAAAATGCWRHWLAAGATGCCRHWVASGAILASSSHEHTPGPPQLQAVHTWAVWQLSFWRWWRGGHQSHCCPAGLGAHVAHVTRPKRGGTAQPETAGTAATLTTAWCHRLPGDSERNRLRHRPRRAAGDRPPLTSPISSRESADSLSSLPHVHPPSPRSAPTSTYTATQAGAVKQPVVSEFRLWCRSCSAGCGRRTWPRGRPGRPSGSAQEHARLDCANLLTASLRPCGIAYRIARGRQQITVKGCTSAVAPGLRDSAGMIC